VPRGWNNICSPECARGDESNKHCGSSGHCEPARNPAACHGGFFGDLVADAREERGRHFDIDGGAQAGVEGGKKRLFQGEGGAALGAGGEVRAQFTLGLEAGGGGFG
jgi:hypothetical protein